MYRKQTRSSPPSAKEQDCPLYPVDFSQLTPLPSDLSGTRFSFGNLENLALPLLGSYQPYNAAVAITTLKVLDQRGWHISDAAIREGLRKVQWPGRFELLRTEPPFLLDGSHNPHGKPWPPPRACRMFPGQKFTFLISVMADKDVTGILTPILPLAKEFVTVRANLPAPCPLKSWQCASPPWAARHRRHPPSRTAWHWPSPWRETTARSAPLAPSTSPPTSARHWPSRAIEIPYNLAIQIPV